jgi:hypothetical protein
LRLDCLENALPQSPQITPFGRAASMLGVCSRVDEGIVK